jgi:hypothetical protein
VINPLLPRFGIAVALAFCAPAFAAPMPELAPFPIDWSKVPESVVDLSGCLEAPAGKDGFIRVEGEHLVTPRGKRFRIWGTNICARDCFPLKDEAPAIAADLARWGFNVIRFHHMDSGQIFDQKRIDTRALDPDSMDRLDFFVAELKKRGIYTNLNLNVSRQFKAGDGVRDYNLLGYAKGATYFNPRLIELQREYARQLLTHYNPYTKSEYRNEPAVIIVEMVNENSLVEAWVANRLVGKDEPKGNETWKPLPVSYTKELTEQYNVWLAKNRTPEQIAHIRAAAGVKEGELIPRLQKGEFTTAPVERFHAEARFIMEKEHRFFEGMRDLLKNELGVKSILVGSADHNDGVSGYPHIHANMTFDLIDGHGYWEHPRLDGGFWMRNTAMVNDPFDSTVVQFARTPVVGRPFTISEVNHPFPNEYTCEGFPILTAYALFHDWDGIYWFAYGQPRLGSRKSERLSYFDFGDDPVKMSQLMVCGLMFHRQDLRKAEQTIVRAYSPTEVIETIRMGWNQRPFFTKGFGLSIPLEHATRLTFEGAPSKYPEHTSTPLILSDTKEIAWYNDEANQNLVAIETPRTQALIGFLNHKRSMPERRGPTVREGAERSERQEARDQRKEAADRSSPTVKEGWKRSEREEARGQRKEADERRGPTVKEGRISLLNLAADLQNDFCALLLTSMDDKPIARSSRLLLSATARGMNTGLVLNADRHTVATFGKYPPAIEVVKGAVVLRGLENVSGLHVQPLTAEGRPLGPELEAERDGGNWRIPIGEVVTTWYLLKPTRQIAR